MIVAFEGPDGVGKSTLIDYLVENAPTTPTVQVQRFPSSSLLARRDEFRTDGEYGRANIEDMYARADYSLDTLNLYDRYWPSTAVYNFDGHLPIDEYFLPRVDLFVFVTAPYDLHPKVKGELTREEFDYKMKLYERLFNDIRTPHITFDTTKDNPQWLLSALLNATSSSPYPSETAE